MARKENIRGHELLRLTIDQARAIKGIKLDAANKYHVAAKVKRTVDGIVFASKKEADFYCAYRALWKAGEIKMMLRQVPFHLPGGVKYLLDFMLFNNDGSIEFVEVKGFDNKLGRVKRKMVEDLFKIEVRVV